jgi:hypothetical protein
VFETGDLNKIKDLLIRYSLLHLTHKQNSKPIINLAESLTGILGFFDEETCLNAGLDPA